MSPNVTKKWVTYQPEPFCWRCKKDLAQCCNMYEKRGKHYVCTACIAAYRRIENPDIAPYGM